MNLCQKIKKIIKSESGFTLIELLVVIGIIAILATIGAINFSSARAKARDAKRIADIKQIQSAIEVEAAGTSSGLFPAEATVALPNDIQLLSPPRATDEYCYIVGATNTSYTVAAIGLEDSDNANSDGNPTVTPDGIGMQVTTVGAACNGGAAVNCAASTTYCLNGSTSG